MFLAETGLMSKGLNSGRCDWTAALQTPACLAQHTAQNPGPRSGLLASMQPVQGQAQCRDREVGGHRLQAQPNRQAQQRQRLLPSLLAAWFFRDPTCSRRPETSPHGENSPVRVTRLGSPLSPTAVQRRAASPRISPSSAGAETKPRQNWRRMEKGRGAP